MQICLMQIIVCPGVHPPELTDAFVGTLPALPVPPLLFPAAQPAYSAVHILAFLMQQLIQPSQPSASFLSHWNQLQRVKAMPVLWIGFSAGVVGAMGAAHLWQSWGGQVVALIAFDGWGVPLWAPFPVHRLSHDAFTHWSSAALGAGQTSFYAEPAVPHHELWCSPQQAQGWAVQPTGNTYTTAAQFVASLIRHYAGN